MRTPPRGTGSCRSFASPLSAPNGATDTLLWKWCKSRSKGRLIFHFSKNYSSAFITFQNKQGWHYLGNKEFHRFSKLPSSADNMTPWTNSQLVLHINRINRLPLLQFLITIRTQMCSTIKVALTNRVWRISDNDVKGILVLLHEFKAVSHVEGEFGTEKPFGHAWEELLWHVNDILQKHSRKTDVHDSSRCSIGDKPNSSNSLKRSCDPYYSHLIYFTQDNGLHQWIFYHFP